MPYAATIDGIAQTAITQNVTAGIQIAVWRDDRIEYQGSFGTCQSDGQRVTDDSEFNLSSLTKMYTAAATLGLVESGKLHLDDRLAQFLPKVSNADAITIDNLLHQTSGLHDYANDALGQRPPRGTISPKLIFAQMSKDTPDFEPDLARLVQPTLLLPRSR